MAEDSPLFSDRWMGVAEAALYIAVSRATLYIYMQDGRLPYYHLKGSSHRRIKQSDLDALLERIHPAGDTEPGTPDSTV